VKTQDEGVIRVLDDNVNPNVKGGNLAGKSIYILEDTNSSFNPAIELVHELAEYLSRRYPTTFHVSRHVELSSGDYQWGWDGLPPIKSITVVPLRETHDLPVSTTDGEHAGKRAMIISALLSV